MARELATVRELYEHWARTQGANGDYVPTWEELGSTHRSWWRELYTLTIAHGEHLSFSVVYRALGQHAQDHGEDWSEEPRISPGRDSMAQNYLAAARGYARECLHGTPAPEPTTTLDPGLLPMIHTMIRDEVANVLRTTNQQLGDAINRAIADKIGGILPLVGAAPVPKPEHETLLESLPSGLSDPLRAYSYSRKRYGYIVGYLDGKTGVPPQYALVVGEAKAEVHADWIELLHCFIDVVAGWEHNDRDE